MYNIHSLLEKNLENYLINNLPSHAAKDVYLYSLIPAGKLFRPRLVHAMSLDLTGALFTKNHSLLANAVEIHHAYTLIHDDLPSMDDDNMRRGRESSHIKFNEWKALLTGDGLLNLSFQALSEIDHPNSMKIINLFSRLLGPNGLIHGQYLDLSEEMNDSINKLVETHILKTARLIQVCLVSSYLLEEEEKSLSKYLALFKLGHYIGLTFQLLDDLGELCEAEIGQHEQAVNPWKSYNKEPMKLLIKSLKNINRIINNYELKELNKYLQSYFLKTSKKLKDGEENIQLHTELELMPIVSMLNVLGHSN